MCPQYTGALRLNWPTHKLVRQREMTASLTTIWQRISQLGVNTLMPFYLVQKRIVFNQTVAGLTILSALHLTYLGCTQHNNWPPMVVALLGVAAGLLALWFMRMKRFQWAVTVLFTAFPALAAVYAIITGIPVVYFAHFILLVLAFYLLRTNRSTLLAGAFIFACFIFGFGYQLITAYSLTMRLLLFATSVFVLGFVVLYGIRKQVCQYEAALKANNIYLKQARQNAEIQKAALEKQAVLLEQQTTTLTELNEIKTRLFSILSHDLRGHVHAIHHALQLGNSTSEGHEFLLQNLPALEKDAADACSLLEGILTWSKTLLHAAQPAMEPVELGHLVKGVLKFYEATADKKAVFFQVQMDRRLMASCDRNMMETVFRNIINNAIKFSATGQPVVVTGKLEQGCVVIAITNKGQSIEPQLLKRIAEDEFTGLSLAAGTDSGIGLLLTKELLQKNQGLLHIYSRQEAGTTVVVKIPHMPAFAALSQPVCSN